MAEPTNDEAIIAGYYRTAFTGPSLGTEEELSGTTIKMRPGAGNLLGLVRHKETGEVLVLITRDLMRENLGPYASYTIELRTTPIELRTTPPGKGKLDGWDLRRRALQVAIWNIENCKGKELGDDDYGGFATEMSNRDQQVREVPANDVAEAGAQMTVGVAAEAIGVGASAGDRASGKIHPLLMVPWYIDRFTADHAAAGLSGREKIGYALVMSAILKLAAIWAHYPGRLNLLEAKNLWVVRPRTPPIQILDTFDVAELPAVMDAIGHSALPDWASQHVTAQLGHDTWDTARDHIVQGKPMGGHPLPAATISGAAAMLFEYRQAPVNEYPYAFWRHGELTFNDF